MGGAQGKRRQADLTETVLPTARPQGYLDAWAARRLWEPLLDDVPDEVQHAAARVVERARQKCWACKHLRAAKLPTCTKGHPVGWQLRYASGNNSYPRCLDRLDFGDQEP